MFTQLRKLIFAPPLEDTDKDRVATLLNVMLILLFVGSLTYIPVVLFLAPERISRLPLVILIAILATGLKVLLHRGRVYRASGILVAGLWSILTIAILSGGGVHDSGYSAYIVVIVIAALLLGGRATLIFAVLSILIGVVALYAESIGFVIPSRATSFTALALWFLQSIYISVAAGLLYLAARSINSALHEARTSAESARKSEQEYRLLMEEASDAIFIADGQGKYLDVNARACELLGYTRDELLQLSIQQIIAPENMDAEPIHFAELRSHMTVVIERPLQNKDGRIIPTEVSARMLEDGRLLAIVRDITSRKKTEDNLRQERDFSNAAIDSLPGVFYVFNTDGDFLRWNRRFEQTSGSSADEIRTMHPLDFIHEEDRSRVAERIEETFRSGDAIIEARFLMKQGIARPYYFTGNRIEIDGQIHLVGVGIDITDRKQAEKALEESEQRYRALAESSSVGIWHIDTDGYTVYANPAMCAILEIEDMNVLKGRTYHEFFTEDSLSIMRREHAKRPQGIASAYEVEMIGREGGRRDILVSGAPLFTDDGQLESLIGTFVNITDRKQAEAQELEAERLQLELENERKITQLKSRFMSIVAHEFRTPLAVINLNCDLLNKYQNRLTDEKREQHFQKIQMQMQHLERLLDDFSLAVRAQSGHLEYQPTKLDLRDLVHNIVLELGDISGKNHQLIFDDKTSTGIAMGDERLLAYVIRNLLLNAIKYSPDGGVIRCELLEEANAFIIRVSDEGIGIPPDDQEHLFEAYYRAENVGKISGTGLGLKIVKDCVDLHNGQITVESEINQGTTFKVSLPVINQ